MKDRNIETPNPLRKLTVSPFGLRIVVRAEKTLVAVMTSVRFFIRFRPRGLFRSEYHYQPRISKRQVNFCIMLMIWFKCFPLTVEISPDASSYLLIGLP